MAYRCDQAVIGGARDAIRCKVSGSVCAHQKMCMMEGRIVLTDGALRCPARDGKLPGEYDGAREAADAAERRKAEAAAARAEAVKTAEAAAVRAEAAKDAEGGKAKRKTVSTAKTAARKTAEKKPARNTAAKPAARKAEKA